jgi:acetyl-CoA acetyltransferase
MIADPLRVLDCVMFCDGANAFLIMSEEEARARGLTNVARIAAYAEVTNHRGTEAEPDVTESGFTRIAPVVYAKAGLSPADIGMFQPYDDFTIAVLMQLEAFGFCARGSGSEFVLKTDLSPRGSLPLNTGGGQISMGQPGLAGGGLNLAEAVRQLFGEAGARQVDQPSNALITGIGVIPYGRNWSSSAAMILTAQ